MSVSAKGTLAAIASNILFAMLFLYSSWMKPMSGTDVFAWRMVGMLAVLPVLMSFTKSWGVFAKFLRSMGCGRKKWFWLMLPTPLLASQLWLFIWAPVNGEGLNVATGYFLFPLTMMFAGRIVFHERLNILQKTAVSFACAGVAWELLRTGAFSWTTAWVFGTYPLYYLIRRRLGVPSLVGLMIDMAVIAPCAAVYIFTVSDSLSIIAAHPSLIVFIILLGINSAVAMHFNLQANNLLPMALFGMLSYLEPMLLFGLSITLLGEPLDPAALVSYALIWIGFSIMIANGLAEMKRKRRRQ